MAHDLKERAPAALAPHGAHDGIYRLEAALLKLPQVDMPVTHEHCDGLYARTIKIPADVALTGMVHRHECFFLVRRGQIAVTTDKGVVLLNAGDMVTSAAGSKRTGVTLTDVEITTFHANPTNERDSDALWDLYVEPAPARALGVKSVEML